MEDAELDINLQPELWGAHVTESKPVPLESEERRLTVSRATLEKGNKAQLFLGIKGTKYALGTLNKDKREYTKLKIDIFQGTEAEYSFSVVGDGTVALIGSYSPPVIDDEFDSLSDFEDSDENEDNEAAYAAALEAASKPKSAGIPQQAAKPAAKNQLKGQQNQQKGQQQDQQKGQQQKGQQQKGQQKGQQGQQKGQQQKGKPTAETKPAEETTSPKSSAAKPEVEEDKSETTSTSTPNQKKGNTPGQKKRRTESITKAISCCETWYSQSR